MNSNTVKIVKKIQTEVQPNSKRMIFASIAVLLACVIGASLGGPIEKREATATPCVNHTLGYTHINSTLLESIRRICRTAKDLDKHISITAKCPNNTLPDPYVNFDEVLEEVQTHFPTRISTVIRHGQNIDPSTCITLEDERLRLNITSKLAVLGNTVQEMVNARYRTRPSIPDFHDFKCEAQYVANSIKRLIGVGPGGNDWWFTSTTGPLGCE